MSSPRSGPRPRYAVLVAVLVAVLLGGGTAAAADLELRFIDVGQGDATLIRNGGKAVLIDTGPSDRIVEKLRSLGVESLELLIISHNHADHLGGADAVLGALPVAHYVDNGFPTKSKIQGVILDLVAMRGTAQMEATNRTIALGDAILRIIPPATNVGGDEQNNTSVAVIVERGRFKALLSGDSEVEEINFWLAAGLVPDVDVLKAAHHGSRNGVTPLWLHRAKPEVVVISVGAGNPYSHPHPMALRYYQTGGRRIFRTDHHGDVVIKVTPEGAYRVETERAGPPAAVAAPTPAAAPMPAAAPTPARHCCRTCRKGRACGDGCIPKDSACQTPPGCACDAQ